MAPSRSLFVASVAIMLLAGLAHAQLSQLLSITGIVRCSDDAAGITATSTTAVFPNAGVQLRCGGNVIANTTTNSTGAFNIRQNMLTSLVPMLLNSCNVVVTTPLATCNSSLPTNGLLQSPLQLLGGGGLLGGLIGGLLGTVVNLIPSGFNWVPLG